MNIDGLSIILITLTKLKLAISLSFYPLLQSIFHPDEPQKSELNWTDLKLYCRSFDNSMPTTETHICFNGYNDISFYGPLPLNQKQAFFLLGFQNHWVQTTDDVFNELNIYVSIVLT